jgi:hypothetical protein
MRVVIFGRGYDRACTTGLGTHHDPLRHVATGHFLHFPFLLFAAFVVSIQIGSRQAEPHDGNEKVIWPG